ncbi:MAG: 50S ribosomal protein L15 [Anaerolineaceae bacterium]|nr:50S ribosomal protein L15 [Anaerolineaceae bacterium]
MKLHELKPNTGATHRRRRVGCGYAAGQGKTCGRGTKGQKSRAGWGGKLYFQGCNLPFYRRLPFRRGIGMHSINRVEYNEFNVDDLARCFAANDEVTSETMNNKNMLGKSKHPVVILGTGEINVPLTVKVSRVSKTAREKIEAAGGSVELIA